MLFKRRTPPGWLEYLRVWIWPRRSWLRSTQYVTKRILRITATPHAIAAGVGVGVFTSFTPFMGLHFLFAFVLAWLLRGNMIAAALGTFFGNPLSFPFIWAATFSTGNFVLGRGSNEMADIHLGTVMKDIIAACWAWDWAQMGALFNEIWEPLLYPMVVGGSILGPLFGIPAYFLTWRATLAFRERRRDRLMEKAAAIQAQAKQLVEKQMLAEKAG